MRTNVIVVDNFFDDPDAVRAFFLSQPFGVKGNYPGGRTKGFADDNMKKVLEQIVGKKITYWPDGPDSFNGACQYVTSENRSWWHRDCTTFAGVVYLTPNAPLTGGTAFFRHKATGLEECPPGTPKAICEAMDNDSNDASKWEQVDNVGNVYNRLVLFRGTRTHRSMEYFGDCKENGRLFMLFFFNVEE